MKIEKKKKIWKKVREKMIVRLESFRAFSQTSTRDLSRPITSGEQHRWLFARLKHSPFRRFCFWSRKRSEGVRWFISRTPYWAAASGTRPRKFPKLFSPLSTDLSDHFLAFEILANPRPFRHAKILSLSAKFSKLLHYSRSINLSWIVFWERIDASIVVRCIFKYLNYSLE